MTTIIYPFISSTWQNQNLIAPGSLGIAGKLITTPNTYRCTLNIANGPMSFTILPDPRMIIGSFFVADMQAIAPPYGAPLNPIGPLIRFPAVNITNITAPLVFKVWGIYNAATRGTGFDSDWVYECGGWFENPLGIKYAQLQRMRITWNYS